MGFLIKNGELLLEKGDTIAENICGYKMIPYDEKYFQVWELGIINVIGYQLEAIKQNLKVSPIEEVIVAVASLQELTGILYRKQIVFTKC